MHKHTQEARSLPALTLATPKSFGKPGASSSPQVSLTEQGTLQSLGPLFKSQLHPHVAPRLVSQSINPWNWGAARDTTDVHTQHQVDTQWAREGQNIITVLPQGGRAPPHHLCQPACLLQIPWDRAQTLPKASQRKQHFSSQTSFCYTEELLFLMLSASFAHLS